MPDSVYKYIKLATIVEDVGEGRYSFLFIAPLYPWSLPYNAEC